jgi:hypothetical protein
MTAHGALWKWRAAENEGKPKPGFPSLFPGPWKSPGDSPILHSADRGCLCLKTPTKTKERSPRFALARFSLLQAHSSIRKCSRSLSGPKAFDRFQWHDPRNALHDFLILLSLLQIAGRLPAHP